MAPLIATAKEVATPEASSCKSELTAPVVVGEVGVHVFERYIKTWPAVGVVEETERDCKRVTVNDPAFVMLTSPPGATAVATVELLPTQIFAAVNDGKVAEGAAQANVVPFHEGTWPFVEQVKFEKLPELSLITRAFAVPDPNFERAMAADVLICEFVIVVLAIFAAVIALLAIVTAPVLAIVASPLIATAVATEDPLPTHRFVLARVGKLAAGDVQDKTPEPFVVSI